MDPLLITTTVDLSGANQLASGVEAAMARVVQAQVRAKSELSGLKEAYSALGASVAGGNQQAAAAIGQHEAAVVAANAELKAAKAAYVELTSATEGAASSTELFTEAQERANAATGIGISERQAATAGLRVLEGGMMGSTRAAGALLTNFLGLGPIIQAAFPVIGAIALIQILSQFPKMLSEIKDWWAGVTEEAKKSFSEQSEAATRAIAFQSELENKKLHLPEAGESGSRRTQQEIADYQKEIEVLGQLTMQLAAAQAGRNAIASIQRKDADNKVPAFLSPGKSEDEAIAKQRIIQDAADLQANLSKAGYQVQAPKLNVEASDKEFQREADEYFKGVTKILESAKEKIATIGAITIPTLQAKLPSELSKETEQAGAARIEADRHTSEAEVALADATAKHLFDIGKSSAAEEQATLAANEQRKLDIRIKALQDLDALKTKSPTYSVDTSAQADVAKNEGEITVLQTQKQTTALEAQDKIQKAIAEAQIKSIDLQVDAAKRGSQTKLDLIQQELNVAVAAFGTEGTAYDGLVAKYISATHELQEERSKMLEESIRAADREAEANEKAALSGIKAQQDALATETEISKQRIALQSATGAAGGKDIYAEQTALLASATAQQIALIKQAANAQVSAQQQIRDANLAAASQDTTDNHQKEIDAAAEAADKIADIEASMQAQISATEDKASKEREQLWIQETKEELKAINDFVTQGTNAFNSFLVTITTTTGVVNGRPSEFRFIGEEWQKMVFQMEKDFLSAILKMVEDTALFQGIQNKIKSTFANLFGSIGLGPTSGAGAGTGAGAAVGGATTAEQSTATSALIAFTAALHTSTLALTQGNVATNADTAATHASAVATLTDTGATHTDTAATLTSTAATHTDTAATVTSATASHAGAAATLTSAGANTANATAATTSATVFGSHTLAVIADTIATQAHKIAQFLGFEEGGVIPFTGLHLLHAGERVLSVKQRASYEQMAAAGGERLPEHAFDTFRSAQYAFAGAESLRAGDDGETDDRSESSRSAASSVGSGDSSASDMHFHYHASPVSALDSAGVRDVISNNRKEWEKIAMDGVRRGAINPRRFVR
jgi:hypothetical protein